MSHIHDYSTLPQCSLTAFKLALSDPDINKGLDRPRTEAQKAITLKLTGSHRRTNTSDEDSGQGQQGDDSEDKMCKAEAKSICMET